MPYVSIHSPELPLVIRQLHNADSVLAKARNRHLHDAAEPARRAMSASASAAGMMQAARGTRAHVNGDRIDMEVSARNARPLDKPNAGGYNRHPVFGNYRNEVLQPARRFSDRGFDAGSKDVERALDAALEDLAHYLG